MSLPPIDFAIFLKNNFPARIGDLSDRLFLNRPNRSIPAASMAGRASPQTAGRPPEFNRLNENP
ncbi:hypothetical protein B5P46_32985 [Rhizobium leguminosarum]|uniref:Uncharacterized protein n=1 Tax=Rhizobium leguminosarum TaxID=384 RepID=A0A4Q1TCU2_RHILE|nr:hypothetical protein B5P46_32985 [Rhizobium leguminosarum]